MFPMQPDDTKAAMKAQCVVGTATVVCATVALHEPQPEWAIVVALAGVAVCGLMGWAKRC